MSLDQADFRDWLNVLTNVAPKLPSHIRIDDNLARGGQGAVYRGTVNGAPAAIKIYYSGDVQRRIDREVEALNALNCYSIVKLLWSGYLPLQNTELPVVATSLVAGAPLDQIIRTRRLNYEELSVLTFDVTTAIEHLWNKRIVHRDLKPSNMLIGQNGRACVIDLGIARHIDQFSLTTTVGATWGTVGYLSPEQARGVRELTCKSDMYALGIVLIECAMGRHPTNRDQARLFDYGLHERLPDEVAAWRHASLLMKFLHPRPTARPLPSAVLDELADYSPVNT
jgi:eukaryotic-like serine/threonine-protein kinase